MAPLRPLISASIAVLVLTAACSSSEPDQTPDASISTTTTTPTSQSDTVRVEGSEVKILVLPPPRVGEGQPDSQAFATLATDQATHCVVDEANDPIAFPPGTHISGPADDWTITTKDGNTFKEGETIKAGGLKKSAARYDKAPSECGQPPWTVLHSDIAPVEPGDLPPDWPDE